MSIKNNLFIWLPALAWAGVIFLFSSRPAVTASTIDWQDFFIKKSAHFIEYLILALLVYRAIRLTSGLLPSRTFFLTLFVCMLYAVSDEWHQSFIPGRGPHVRDILIDTFGAGVSAWIFGFRKVKFPLFKNLLG